MMTTLEASSVPRSISWSAVRLLTAALLLIAGISCLLYAWQMRRGDLVGIGVILTLLGAATLFERTAEQVMIPVLSVLLALIPFGLFILFVAGKNPITVIKLMYEGAFGSWFVF